MGEKLSAAPSMPMARVAPRPLSTDNVHGPVRVAIRGVVWEVESVAMGPGYVDQSSARYVIVVVVLAGK